jgi:Rrf2 family protein
LIATIAERERIPRKFLEAILLQLKTAGVLESKKGRQGGYSLAAPPTRVTLGEVIRIVDGPLAPLRCASETAYERCEECPDAKLCPTRIVMQRVRNAIAEILDSTTLAMACDSTNVTPENWGFYEI